MSDFDAVLESGFQEVTNRENFARQIEANIKEIDGASALIPARRYGEPVSAEKVRANLRLRLLIEQESPQLAVCFGPYAGVAHHRLEEKEARERIKQRTQMLTENSRAANEQARQDRESGRTVLPSNAVTGASNAESTSPLPWLALRQSR